MKAVKHSVLYSASAKPLEQKRFALIEIVNGLWKTCRDIKHDIVCHRTGVISKFINVKLLAQKLETIFGEIARQRNHIVIERRQMSVCHPE